jgi:hypothetical protein
VLIVREFTLISLDEVSEGELEELGGFGRRFLEPSMVFGIDGTMAGRRVLELMQVGFVEPVGFAVDWAIDAIDGIINPIDKTGWEESNFIVTTIRKSTVMSIVFCCMVSTCILADNSHDFAWDSRKVSHEF